MPSMRPMVLKAGPTMTDAFAGWEHYNQQRTTRRPIVLEAEVLIAIEALWALMEPEPAPTHTAAEVKAVLAETVARMGKHETEVMRSIAVTKRAKGTARLDELLEAVIAAVTFPHAPNEIGALELFDGYTLVRKGAWLYVKHPKLPDGIVIAFKDMTGWDVIDRRTLRGDLERFMVRVHNAPALPAAPRPAARSGEAFGDYPAAFLREYNGVLMKTP